MALTAAEQKRKDAQERIKKFVQASLSLDSKTAGLRRIAEEEPHEVGNALQEMAGLFQDVAEVFSGLAGDATSLQSNLDLTEPAKTASIRDRVAARRNYARTLRRLANEEPAEIGAALSEVYNQIDDAVQGIEAIAERFGLPLDTETEASEVAVEDGLPIVTDEFADKTDETAVA